MVEKQYQNGDRYVGELLEGKRHGQGTYYYADGDKYVGNYKNGKKCGFGIWYYKNGDRYEGNFEQGEINGKGTFYYFNGDKFVGTFKNGEREGKGVYYYKDGDRKEGEWKKDKLNGPGVVYTKDGLKIEVNFKDNVEDGQSKAFFDGGYALGKARDGELYGLVKYFFDDGCISETFFVNNTQYGHRHDYFPDGFIKKSQRINGEKLGIEFDLDGENYNFGYNKDGKGYGIINRDGANRYIGYFDTKTNGFGFGIIDGIVEYGVWDQGKLKERRNNPMFTLENYDVSNYSGDIRNNKFNGNGTYVYSSGDKFTGNWKNGKRSGKGKIIFTNGDEFEGEFNEDCASGFGVFNYTCGDKYEGEFKNGLRHGKGTHTYCDGDKYTGEFKNDCPDGFGVLSFVCGDKYVGWFKNWLFSGLGTYYYQNGAIYVGEFSKHLRNGEGAYFAEDDSVSYGIWENERLKQKKYPLSEQVVQLIKNNEKVQKCISENKEANRYFSFAKYYKDKSEKYKNLYFASLYGSEQALKPLQKDKNKYATYYYAKYLEEMGYSTEKVICAYEKAIKKKSIYAMMKLAEMYKNGELVKKDKEKAKKLYKKASKYKSKDTIESLEASKARLALLCIDNERDDDCDFEGFVSPMTGLSIKADTKKSKK